MDTYTVEETGVYRSTDGKESIQFNAGAVIPMAEAVRFGMPGAALTTEPDLSPGGLRTDLDALTEQVESLPGGGISLPAGAVPLSASSGIVTFEDTAGADLSPVIPAGATPLWWDIVTTEDLAGIPDAAHLLLGTATDDDYFLGGANNLAGFLVGSMTRVPSPTIEASHLMEVLAEEATARVTFVEEVGGGATASAGEYAVVLYWLPAAS